MNDTITLDTRGLKCPLPVLKARKKLQSMPKNADLTVIADDPAAIIDFPHFCSEQGHFLVSDTSGSNGELIFILRNKGAENG